MKRIAIDKPTEVLKITLKNGVATGLRGAFFWPVSFFLKEKSDRDKGGWIIQEIEASADDLQPKDTTINGLPAHYWEAFRVQPNSSMADQYPLPDGVEAKLYKSGIAKDLKIGASLFSDTYWMVSAPTGSSGTVTIEGQAFFINCNNDNPPKGFKAGDTPFGPGKLPYTESKKVVQELLDATYESDIGPTMLDHNIKVKWTKDQPKTEVVSKDS